ncbi:MAG: SGNH/GDSL hydrolase family protein [Edaphobacter sp.]
MHWKLRGWALIGVLLVVLPATMTMMKVAAAAQSTQGSAIATTQVTDTVFLADGTLASGTVIVTWQAFTTASGESVPSGTTSATITAGALSLQLVPNAGSTPMGTYYTAVYHLNDGSVSREFWVVPVSQFPVLVSAIKSTVLPTSVAMQTVSKSYVDTAIAAAVTGHPLDSSSPFVLKAGDTMTGPLILPGDPTTPNDAADKNYVDVSIASVTGGVGQKVSLLPSATQTVTQPVGTLLQVNNLNGDEYASQYVTGLGGNGVANALTSPDCASGCDVKVERSYASPESYNPSAFNSGTGGTHVEDDRNGQRSDFYLNPTSATVVGNDAGQIINVVSTRNTAAEFAAGGSQEPNSSALTIQHEGVTGGSNLFPQTIENVPYFKTNYDAMSITGTYNTMGQHALNAQSIHCYGVGDCLLGSQFITASGGFRDEADEGAHPYDFNIEEDSAVFQGTCASGCTTGSTVVTVAVSSAPGTQGEGRYLIDKNPAKTITSGLLTGGTLIVTGTPGAAALFSGTNFPVSVFLSTAQSILSQANNIAPGTVTVPIATSGVPAGFATSTAAVPNQSGVACVTDQPLSQNPSNYEMANYTVVDGTHLQMTLNKVHGSGATIAFGGLCGYGLEQTVDTVGLIRQVFPVIGSYSSTGLYYAGSVSAIVGLEGSTSSFVNVTLQVAAIARSNNVVTVTTAGSLPVDVNGLTMTVSGVADSSYNGSFTVTSTSINTLTYAQTGANSTSTGGTVAKLTGGYVLYPMAEVLGVFDAATKSIDGQLTLAPNTVPWGANDSVEEPHYYQEAISADTIFVEQTTPRSSSGVFAGVAYEGNVGPGVTGWSISNTVGASSYFSNGGTHTVPNVAYQENGIWKRTMDMQAGEQSVFSVHCNSRGCGRWNSNYNLFELDSNVGVDTVAFIPGTSTMQMILRGTGYTFSPQAFTAGTINAQTINATTLNGAISAAQLPVFGISGSGHAPGAVPDPGATAGSTRYLREDGTWSVPAGGGSSGLGVGTGSGSGFGFLGSAPIAGATADYNFLQGSGTTLTDISGNGNNATLGSGAQAPTWTPNGLQFVNQENVSLPATLNSSKTFFLGVYLSPITDDSNTAVINGNVIPAFVSSSLDFVGTNLLYWQFNGNAGIDSYASTGIFSPSIGVNNSRVTSVPNLISGFHVLTYVLGAGSGSLDHIYIDGMEATYSLQGASGGFQTSGNLFLGSSGTPSFAGSGLFGTIYRFAAMATNTLTSSQILAISGQIRAEIASRGVDVTPKPVVQTKPMLFAIGDSITCGFNGSVCNGVTPWTSSLSLTNQPVYTIQNEGIPGITLRAVLGSEPNRVAPACSSNAGSPVAVVLLGTNDIATLHDGGANTASTITSTMSTLGSEVQVLKGAGCRVFVGTMLSRTGNDEFGTSLDADKDTYDSLILTTAKGVGADGVIDFAANPSLGADGANSNSTFFQADHIHPTAAGQLLLAAAASNELNYYFGFNQANPHVVTAASYTMLAGDGYITSNPVANQTLTLPDCTGQSGAVYTVTNLQSTFSTGVVAGSSSQLIEGLAVGTVVPVPSNSSVSFRDVANPKSVSGCHWER